MRSPRLLIVAALAAAALAPAAAEAKVAKGPSGSKFYSPPASKLKGAKGTMIWARSISGGSLPTGRSFLVLYRSRDLAGKPIAISGVVTLPKGKAPRGGWPVVSWAHGTTGIADVCAPSRFITKSSSNPYSKDLQAEMNGWTKRGFAVVQTDYQGLGTAAMHGYLIGELEGRSVVDIVKASQQLDSRVGKRWAVVGHSQGGHATLWAAAIARSWEPSLNIVGAVGLAPASHISEQAAAARNIDSNPFGGLPGLIIGAGLRYAGIDPKTVLTDKALALLPQIEQRCDLGGQDSWGGLPLNQIFRQDADPQPLLSFLDKNDPENLKTIRVPVLIAQGKSDGTVLPVFTDQLVDQLKAAGTDVTYKKFDGVNHTGIPQAARKDTEAFVEKVLLGG